MNDKETDHPYETLYFSNYLPDSIYRNIKDLHGLQGLDRNIEGIQRSDCDNIRHRLN